MSKIVTPNILVILMTVTSGCADAISFLALGQVLTAAMTGNTVFLGLALVHSGGLKPLGYVFALFGFMLGAAVSSFILRNNRSVKGITPAVLGALGVEAGSMALFGILSLFTHDSNDVWHSLLIIMLAFSMGCQGAAARRINVNGVPTTVITSTTTGLIESLVWNTHGRLTGKTSASKESKSTPVPTSSIMVWMIDIVSYGVGAALCGSIELRVHLHAIWLPFSIVCLTILVAVTSRAVVSTKTNVEIRA